MARVAQTRRENLPFARRHGASATKAHVYRGMTVSHLPRDNVGGPCAILHAFWTTSSAFSTTSIDLT
jgi:hypothetical protein